VPPLPVVAPSKVTQVFSVEFEQRPLQLEADFAVRMNVQPVEMVYDEVARFIYHTNKSAYFINIFIYLNLCSL